MAPFRSPERESGAWGAHSMGSTGVGKGPSPPSHPGGGEQLRATMPRSSPVQWTGPVPPPPTGPSRRARAAGTGPWGGSGKVAIQGTPGPRRHALPPTRRGATMLMWVWTRSAPMAWSPSLHRLHQAWGRRRSRRVGPGHPEPPHRELPSTWSGPGVGSGSPHGALAAEFPGQVPEVQLDPPHPGEEPVAHQGDPPGWCRGDSPWGREGRVGDHGDPCRKDPGPGISSSAASAAEVHPEGVARSPSWGLENSRGRKPKSGPPDWKGTWPILRVVIPDNGVVK